jgi:hypothetical protein
MTTSLTQSLMFGMGISKIPAEWGFTQLLR